MMRSALGLILCLCATASGCAVYASPPPRRVVYVREYSTPPQQGSGTYEDWPPPASAPSQDPGTTVVESEPPPARYEVVTESPGVDFVWVGGYWAWHGGWVWTPGYWHHGYGSGWGWRSGVWVSVGGRSRWRAGGWVRHR
jgi:hypothetical protein